MPVESSLESDIRTLEQTRPLEVCIAERAERQHGVVSRGQLLELGFEAGAIGRRLRAGRLHRLHPGVYAVGHRIVSREGRWMAAVLASGSGAVLSHRSAAALWGMRGASGEGVEVTTQRATLTAGPSRV